MHWRQERIALEPGVHPGEAAGVWTDVGKDGVQGQSSGDGFFLNTTTGTDFTYEADVRLDTAVAAALTFRASADGTRHYTADVDAAAKVVKLWRPGRDLATFPAPIEVTDDANASGQLGVNVFAGVATFQNVRAAGTAVGHSTQ